MLETSSNIKHKKVVQLVMYELGNFRCTTQQTEKVSNACKVKSINDILLVEVKASVQKTVSVARHMYMDHEQGYVPTFPNKGELGIVDTMNKDVQLTSCSLQRIMLCLRTRLCTMYFKEIDDTSKQE